MKLWMTRNLDMEATVDFWAEEPTIVIPKNVRSAGWYIGEGDSYKSSIKREVFRALTSDTLPRKGSKKLVNVKILIEGAKGAK